MPDKYRVPLVLCVLEGRSRQEVAGQLNLPPGTLSSRLATARKLLAQRLSRRGIACSAASLAAAPTVVSTSVPAALFGSTVRMACLLSVAAPGLVPGPVAALAKGVLQAMVLLKVRAAALLFIAIALLAGAGVMLAQSPGDKTGATPSAPWHYPQPAALGAEHAGVRTERFRIHDIQANKGLITVVHEWSFDGSHPNHRFGPWQLPQQQCAVCHMTNGVNTIHGTLLRSLDVNRTQSIDAGWANLYNPLMPTLDLQVRPATRIVIDGKERKLTDLKTGIPVDIEYRPGEKAQALSITAQGKTTTGTVHEVDLETGTLTLHQEEEGKDEIVESDHVVVKDARIVINGKPAKLGDLKPGMRVSVRHSAIKPVLVAVTAAGPRVDGILTAVDPRARTLTLILKTLHLATSPVQIAADAKIQVNGRDATLADLKPGMRLSLRMAAESDRSVAVGISTVPVVRKTSG